MDTKYHRVAPRDLFNEAKLLKCMGRLCLLILDGLTPVLMTYSHDGKPYKIALMEEGSLTITNIEIRIQDIPFVFKTTYNSKSSYPLFLEHDYCEYEVFDEQGNFHIDFIAFVKALSH